MISIAGDGGFGYQLPELSTVARHEVNNLTTIVFRDDAYGNVRRIQQQQFGGNVIASDLLNPDFVKLAEAFGLAGVRANGAGELKRALRDALSSDQPTLIEVPIGEVPSVWGIALT